MTKHERIQAAVRGEAVDRVPIAIWRHWPIVDQTAEGLAQAVLEFQRRFDFDLVKVTPENTFPVADWGVTSEYRGNDQGTREALNRPIRDHHDWLRIRPLDVTKGVLGREVDCIRLVNAQLGGQVPILQTAFSPMTVASKLTNERFVHDVRDRRSELRKALEAITQTVTDFVQACLEAGADGIFYATQSAATATFTEDQFREFGMENDLRVLESIKGKAKLVLLHIHGMDVMFDLLTGYPVDAINWHDRRTPPSLREALTRCTRGLAGGINEKDTLPKGTAEQVHAEASEAIAQTSGRRLIVAPGCVMPVTTPEENITAARCTVEKEGPK